IAAQLNPDDPAAAAQEAGRIALRRMEAHVASGTDFAVETTLSGRAYARRIRHWQERGYRVAIIYLRLPSAEYAVERVAQRVAEGGHDIPEAVVRRRFDRGWANFRGLYREVADEWLVYDSSVRPPLLMEESPGWQGVREPGAAGRSMVGGDVESPRATADRGRDYESTGRSEMTGRPGRFPKGEPSVKSVTAALARAQEVAMARANAVRGGGGARESADDAGTAARHVDPASAAEGDAAGPGEEAG
ncbi:MAG: hypothetical protein F4022_11565, partial [Gemmatimonadetes bacterium]|nr:hypothetical protein [Gemmatimonadota bacterium]